jgi:hypothetical protein
VVHEATPRAGRTCRGYHWLHARQDQHDATLPHRKSLVVALKRSMASVEQGEWGKQFWSAHAQFSGGGGQGGSGGGCR